MLIERGAEWSICSFNPTLYKASFVLMLPVKLYQKEDNLNVKLQVGQIEESVATLSSTLEEAQKVHSDLLQVPFITSSGR